MQFWHELEVHSVNTREESEWYENGGNYRQYTHHLVGAHTQAGNVKVHDVPNSVPVTFQEINHGHGIVVAIAKEWFSAIGN